MARPAIISDDVYHALVRIAREQPIDMNHEVSIAALIADEVMIAKGYTVIQLNCAVGLLTRRERIIEVERGLFKVAVSPEPIEGMKVPRLLRDLRMSDEGIFFHQMSMLFSRRAFA